MMSWAQSLDILLFSIRDGFVQVSAFVAITVLLFSYIQYRSGGRLIDYLENNERLQPIAGALLGLTPGCGGAIIAMPLYIRGTVSFGTVVAALASTAGDSAFVILALAPEAALWAYGLAFLSAVLFGYVIDMWGVGVGRVDRAVQKIGLTLSGETTTAEGLSGSEVVDPDNSARIEERPDESYGSPTLSWMHRLTHAVHLIWWILATAGLVAGVVYLFRGAPEVPMEFTAGFFGLFTISGLLGTAASFYLHFIGRKYIEDEEGRARREFSSAYQTFRHAAMETSMVTVWVIAAYLIYEYSIVLFSLDIGALAAAAGVFAPVAGAMLGLVPGCAPQIVFAGIYVEGAIPFSALAANAISQDGDALFPLMATDLKAAVVATIYTTIPALIVGIALHYFWPFAEFGFGVIGS